MPNNQHYEAGTEEADRKDAEIARLRDEQFQHRVAPWMQACFGAEISADLVERNHRFLEEALELVQSTGCPVTDAQALVDYVYSRPVGEPKQEVGGVMVTLAALCLAADINMHDAGETELARIWTKVEKIRAKQAAKPRGSALPQAWPAAEGKDATKDKLIAELVEALQNVSGHIDTPIARRRLGISDPHPDWLVGMRAALSRAKEQQT